MSVVRGPFSIAKGDSAPRSLRSLGDSSEADPLAPLIERAGAGDRAALGELLRLVSPAVLRGLRSMLGTSDIDDALQESLLAFVAALPAYRGETSIQRYALRIGIRTALSARRRDRARKGLLDEHVERTEALHPTPSTPPDDLTAFRQREAFRTLLDGIPENQAEALALRVVFECSLEEIAAISGAPVNTIRSRVRLAREALRTKIEGNPTLRQLLEVEP